MKRHHRLLAAPALAVLCAAAAGLAPTPVAAQAGAAAPRLIYTCTNGAGRTLTSDRPIAECHDREQRVLNSDGSLRSVLAPPMTSEERAAADEAENRRAQERAAKIEAVRRDRNLLSRFPNEPAHAKGREAALGVVKDSIGRSEARVAALEKERKPLANEAEFYVGKTMPAKLKQQIEGVDVSIEAQRSIAANQKVELQRVNALFDAELARLKRLWGGAEPGSLGPPPQVAALGKPAPAAKAPSAPASAASAATARKR